MNFNIENAPTYSILAMLQVRHQQIYILVKVNNIEPHILLNIIILFVGFSIYENINDKKIFFLLVKDS